MSLNHSNRRDKDVRCVKDALIEEIFRDRNAGYVTISYGDMGDFNMIHIMVVQLMVGQDTVIQNQFGQKMRLRDLEVGMMVDAEFSTVMTASEPPKARAFMIKMLNKKRSSTVKVDMVMTVDVNNRFFITGNANDIQKQIRFNVSAATKIFDRRGNRICLSGLEPRQMVKVEHASFMTFSIPPQTTAYSVQII